MVVEPAPDREVVILRDRVGDPQVTRGLAHVLEVVLERKLEGVHADHHQARILVFLGPGADVGQSAQPIHAGIDPELDEDDAPAQVGSRERLQVESCRGATQRGQFALLRCAYRAVVCVRGIEHTKVSGGEHDGRDGCSARSVRNGVAILIDLT